MFKYPEDVSWVDLPSFTKHTSNAFRACKTLQSAKRTAGVPQPLTDLLSIKGSCSSLDSDTSLNYWNHLLIDLPPTNHSLLQSILHTAVSIFLKRKLDILSLLKYSDSATSPTGDISN